MTGAQLQHLYAQAKEDGTITFEEVKRMAFEAIESPMVNFVEACKVLGTSTPAPEWQEMVAQGEEKGLLEKAVDGINEGLNGLFA
jgi:hypothetical protein